MAKSKLMKEQHNKQMHRSINLLLIVFALLSFSTAQAQQLTGRFSMLGTTAQADAGDMGYFNTDNRTLSADQQSLRLMLDDSSEQDEWSVHLKMVRQHLDGYPAAYATPDSLFRYDSAAGSWLDENNGQSSTFIGYELDRAVYKRRFENITLAVGRQPIDWGSGRFWQPLNIFGAFAPTDLDTGYKAGIDSVVFDWYPSAFSSLTAAYVLKPKDNDALENSGGLYYRSQVGELSELSLLGGSVLGNTVFGAAFESAWGGMGWRVEGTHYSLKESDDRFLFWIAGVDYQFSDGTLIAAEWYDNAHGANSQMDLGAMSSDHLVGYGLQQQLGRRVLGLMVDRDMTPLLHGSYTLLVAPINDDNDKLTSSLLHQLSLSYSVSNESDLLFSLQIADGKGLNASNVPQSEFGHLPDAMTLRLRFYF
jgi:hypothetical protein